MLREHSHLPTGVHARLGEQVLHNDAFRFVPT